MQDDFETETMEISMGPQHPSTHGVLRLVVKTDGEIVDWAEPDVGYLHRSTEKIAESVSYHGFVPFLDRVDYLAPFNCQQAWCVAVEKLAEIEIPKRAEYIRVVLAELNRIASHLLFIGALSHDLGVVSPFLYAIKDRELVLDLFEMVSGYRMNNHYLRIGGVMRDIPPSFKDKTQEFCDYLEKKINEYHNLLTNNPIFRNRLVGVGVIPCDMAIKWGLSGPNIRASGLKWDLRRNDPYSVYPEFEFDIPNGAQYCKKYSSVLGDCYTRYIIRIAEICESIKIIRQALLKMPEGEVLAKVPLTLKPPPGEIFFRAENPRGELGIYIVSDGTTKPYRVRIRTASFSNLSIFKTLSRGHFIADLVVIVGSLDIVLPEVDR